VRVVSRLPSATEIVCTRGLEEQLVGVTHECDYGEEQFAEIRIFADPRVSACTTKDALLAVP
jgi:hypothetical protein